MWEPLACRSACKTFTLACWGLRVGPSKQCKICDAQRCIFWQQLVAMWRATRLKELKTKFGLDFGQEHNGHLFRKMCSSELFIGVSETGSAKTGSAIDVRIDDAGSILKFRIGFFP